MGATTTMSDNFGFSQTSPGPFIEEGDTAPYVWNALTDSVIPFLTSANYNSVTDSGAIRVGGTGSVNTNNEGHSPGGLVKAQLVTNGLSLGGFSDVFNASTVSDSDSWQIGTGGPLSITLPWRSFPSGPTPAWELELVFTNINCPEGIGDEDLVFAHWSCALDGHTLFKPDGNEFPIWPPVTNISTLASFPGGGLIDTVTISGTFSTIDGDIVTIFLYDPDGNLVQTTARTFTGAGTYVSDPYVPLMSGTYRYQVAYNGGKWNLAKTTVLGDTGEDILVALYPGLSRFNADTAVQEYFLPSTS